MRNVIRFPHDRRVQQEIVTKLDSLREETLRLKATYQRKLSALESLKSSLLREAFSARL
jgi:type I restriction enzyme S subunit